jgi:hypothetical protein
VGQEFRRVGHAVPRHGLDFFQLGQGSSLVEYAVPRHRHNFPEVGQACQDALKGTCHRDPKRAILSP